MIVDVVFAMISKTDFSYLFNGKVISFQAEMFFTIDFSCPILKQIYSFPDRICLSHNVSPVRLAEARRREALASIRKNNMFLGVKKS